MNVQNTTPPFTVLIDDSRIISIQSRMPESRAILGVGE
jgi:hypothetical protein